MDGYGTWSVQKLKVELRRRGAVTTGRKTDLIERFDASGQAGRAHATTHYMTARYTETHHLREGRWTRSAIDMSSRYYAADSYEEDTMPKTVEHATSTTSSAVSASPLPVLTEEDLRDGGFEEKSSDAVGGKAIYSWMKRREGKNEY